VQTHAGEFQLIAYRDLPGDGTHLALVRGEPRPQLDVLVRVHERCRAGPDRCGRRRARLAAGKALQIIAREGCGVLVLLNCGDSSQQLQQRIRAWSGPEEVPAAPRTAAVDLRTYGIGAQILRDLGVGRMKLMAKPRKMPSMAGFGLTAVGYLEGG